MPIKLKKNSEYLSTTKFPISARGCYAYEVDTVFDQIIKDYETVENNQLLSNEEYKELISQIEKLKAENIELRVELDNEKSRWKYIKNEGKDIHVDNLELLRRIGRLETIIHERLHINPDEIKTFDPDDC